jgi:hypothetical protein
VLTLLSEFKGLLAVRQGLKKEKEFRKNDVLTLFLNDELKRQGRTLPQKDSKHLAQKQRGGKSIKEKKHKDFMLICGKIDEQRPVFETLNS